MIKGTIYRVVGYDLEVPETPKILSYTKLEVLVHTEKDPQNAVIIANKFWSDQGAQFTTFTVHLLELPKGDGVIRETQINRQFRFLDKKIV